MLRALGWRPSWPTLSGRRHRRDDRRDRVAAPRNGAWTRRSGAPTSNDCVAHLTTDNEMAVMCGRTPSTQRAFARPIVSRSARRRVSLDACFDPTHREERAVHVDDLVALAVDLDRSLAHVHRSDDLRPDTLPLVLIPEAEFRVVRCGAPDIKRDVLCHVTHSIEAAVGVGTIAWVAHQTLTGRRGPCVHRS